jgi:hypothetical protein
MLCLKLLFLYDNNCGVDNLVICVFFNVNCIIQAIFCLEWRKAVGPPFILM